MSYRGEANGLKTSLLGVILNRPVAVLLGHFCLVLFGLLGWSQIATNRMPDVEYPTIMVKAGLPGATPSTMAKAVAGPLESQLCGIKGLLDCTTNCVRGYSTIALRFRPGTNMGATMGDVGRAIRASVPDLPTEMPQPPVYERFNPNDSPLFYLYLESPSTPLPELHEIATRRIAPRLNGLKGVARVAFGGADGFSWVFRADPRELAHRGLGPDALDDAVQANRTTGPGGVLRGRGGDVVLDVAGPIGAEKIDPGAIPLFAGVPDPDQTQNPIWMSDVASTGAEATSPKSARWRNGKPCVIMIVFREQGANVIQLSGQVRAVLRGLESEIPGGAEIGIISDNSVQVVDSINDIILTLLISVGFVFFIVGLGIRDFRSTLVVCAVVPVSLTGTIGFVWLAGFSCNTLSLLALNLSIGFVVDDSVVVLENIIRHREMGKGPILAALDGAREVAFTMLSITVSLLAAFLPILLVPGMLGLIFREFVLTLMGAILISGVVSLLLVPVLSRWLPVVSGFPVDAGNGAREKQSFWHGIYMGVVRWQVSHPLVAVLILLSTAYGTMFFLKVIPKGFLPEEDQSLILLFTKGPPEASWDQVVGANRHAWEMLEKIPEVETHFANIGIGDINTTTSEGYIILKLKPHPRRAIREIVGEAEKIMKEGSPLESHFLLPPTIFLNTKQTKSAYQVLVTSSNGSDLGAATSGICQWMEESGDYSGITSDNEPGAPTIGFYPRRSMLAMSGISPLSQSRALQAGFGPVLSSYLWTDSSTRQLKVGLSEESTREEGVLDLIRIGDINKNDLSHGVPLGQGADFVNTIESRQSNRHNRLDAATISFNFKPGVDASAALTRLSGHLASLPPGPIFADLVGVAREVQNSVRGMGPLVLISFLVMYLALGFLYESLTHPVTVLVGLPSALLGGLIALKMSGLELDIYGFLGLIMLLGLVKKNAIILVDFSRQRQAEGLSAVDAICEASRERLRPIQLTTFAAAAGALPMAVGIGTGVTVLRPVGFILLGGLLLSQFVTLFLTPPVFRVMDWIGKIPGRFLRGGRS